jgi:ectoine hydroxylase
MTDPYHSRTGSKWEVAPRFDPVVWDPGPGPLGPAELRSYAEFGFLVRRGLFTVSEVAAVTAEANRVVREVDPASEEVVAEPDSGAVRSVFRVHQHSPALAALLADQRLAGAARQILGSEVYLHQSRVNYKHGFDGRSFPWHSDFETWHIEDGMPRMRALSASLLLTENTEHNGPLLVVPGSHRHYVRCVGETPEEHYKQSLRKQEYGVPDRAALTELVARGGLASVTGPPGTVVLFDCNLMHGSAGNITPLPRNNVFAVFNSAANRLVAPFGGTAPRPEFLAARAA